MTSPFERAFREELLRVARRDQRRRRYTIRGAIAACGAVVAGLIAALVPGSPAAAEVRVTLRNDVVEVEVTDAKSSADDVLRALHAHGLDDVRVDGVPTGPSNVGRFLRVEFQEQAGSKLQVTYLDPSGAGWYGFRVPADWPGVMTISIGRTAHRGEPYDTGSSPFDDGEPLHCAGVLGNSLGSAAGSLDALDVTIFIAEGADYGSHLDHDAALRSLYRDWYVTGGAMTSAERVLLDIKPQPGPKEETGC